MMPLSGIISPSRRRPIVPPGSRVNEIAIHLSAFRNDIANRVVDGLFIDKLEAARMGWAGSQDVKLWTAQICGGLAFGLFPYTPGMIENCKASHNAGWLCGARICTFIAATGASVIGAMAGLSYWRHRTWLKDYANEMAENIVGSSESSKSMAQAALTDYLNLSDSERRAVRDACRRPRTDA